MWQLGGDHAVRSAYSNISSPSTWCSSCNACSYGSHGNHLVQSNTCRELSHQPRASPAIKCSIQLQNNLEFQSNVNGTVPESPWSEGSSCLHLLQSWTLSLDTSWEPNPIQPTANTPVIRVYTKKVKLEPSHSHTSCMTFTKLFCEIA